MNQTSQDKNQTPANFIRRTDALRTKLGVSLVETGRAIGISKAMLFAYRGGAQPISDKVWRKLSDAEQTSGLNQTYPEQKGEGALRVEEPKGQTAAFREYLATVRGIREEAEKISGGDPRKTEEWFERLLATWRDTVAARRRGTNSPFTAVDDAEIRRAREAISAFHPEGGAEPIPSGENFAVATAKAEGRREAFREAAQILAAQGKSTGTASGAATG